MIRRLPFLLLPFASYSQQFHNPAELYDLIAQSSIRYEARPLESAMEEPKGIILDNIYFVEYKDSLKTIKSYPESENEEHKKLHEKANFAIKNDPPDYETARKSLEKLLKSYKTQAQAMSLLGAIYMEQEDLPNAEKWFRKALTANNYDYYAHWQLAEILYDKDDLEGSLKEISLAHLLNRNNPRLLAKMRDLYLITGKPLTQWKFQPEYKMMTTETGVGIDANSIWISYALYKAVWAYEPGYRAQMATGRNADPGILEEMEALLGLYLTWANLSEEEQATFPAIVALGVAIENEMLEEYILYEIILPQQPILAMYLDNVMMGRLVRYLEVVRR